MAPNLQPLPQRPRLQDHRPWSGLSNISKRSFRSCATSAFEADDERSSSDGDMSPRNSQADVRRPTVPRHSGHDARPTSRKELLGWYAYAFAAETYVICGIASFIPILLETLARENGVLLSDRETPCGSSDSKKEGDGQCIVWVFGVEINTASFAMYTFSVSVLIQALLVVSISCAADHGNYRKKLLLSFAWIGSFAVMSYIFITKDNYILGALLTVISNTSFGASFVLLNSFLPLLVRYHPDVIEVNVADTPDLGNSEFVSRPLDDSVGELQASRVSTTSPLLQPEDGERLKPTASHAEITSKELQLSTRISAIGIGTGYIAALFLQCVCIAQARRLLDIVLFLAGWFLLSDAIATTSSTAILFAKTQLHMKPWALGMINVISTLAGVFGAFGWSWISRLFNLQAHQTILVCIALFELIPLYGLLGYLPFVKEWGVFGLQQPWEMYPLAAVYGVVLGGLSGYCRSLYGELIPPGSEAAFYALYAITDKGSSVFGPTIVGAIIDRTGTIRPAFWFLAALVGFPAPLIWFINVERGRREGMKLAESMAVSPVEEADDDEHEPERRGMLADYQREQEDGIVDEHARP
ncbi:hypothetical protein Y057_8836 [Fusarium fujikuroi]|nr:hypothetical protein Y057_8836 [Fusarium fujikuroi]